MAVTADVFLNQWSTKKPDLSTHVFSIKYYSFRNRFEKFLFSPRQFGEQFSWALDAIEPLSPTFLC